MVSLMCVSCAGVQNITSLGTLITWQKVEYDFDFHKQDFPCNIPALVLSEGKSILKVSRLVLVHIFFFRILSHFYVGSMSLMRLLRLIRYCASSHTEKIIGNSSQNSPIPVLIFWSSTVYSVCIIVKRCLLL